MDVKAMFKNKFILLGLLIFCIGIFLRTYDHGDLIHFELDQARDAFIIGIADEEGMDNLPLLGPQARSRELYLGPIFYYFQFISAKIFGSTPVTIAYPDLLFSILIIPLSYFFARQFFSKRISFYLFALTSFSLFMITYGRFAWNPNSIPFWTMLAAIAIIKSAQWSDNCKVSSVTVDKSSINKAIKGRFLCGSKQISWWFIIAVATIAIAVQLHFIAFLCFPVVFVFYFIFKKITISWRTLLVSVLFAVILFLPIIISEYKTGGQNVRGLFVSVTENRDKDDKHDIVEKLFRNIQKTSTFFTTMFVGDQNGGDMIITKKEKYGYFPLFCDGKCKARLPHLVGSVLFLCISILTFIYYFYNENFKKSGRKIKIDKITGLILPWLLMGGLFLTLIAYQISPRFYLFLYPPFLVLLGSLFYTIEELLPKIGKIISIVIVIVFVGVNLHWTKIIFVELSNASSENVEPSRDLILKRSDRITLEQLRIVASHIVDKEVKEFGNNSKLLVGDNRYARALFYLVNFENKSEVFACYVKRSGFEAEQTTGREYYILVRTKTKTHVDSEMKKTHKVVDKEQFGTLTLYKMIPKNGVKSSPDRPRGCFVQ